MEIESINEKKTQFESLVQLSLQYETWRASYLDFASAVRSKLLLWTVGISFFQFAEQHCKNLRQNIGKMEK
jgi:hypothetical protein